MKKLAILVVIFALILVAVPSIILAKPNDNGNGAPSGPHYNLNIIGTKDKKPDMNNNSGHRIFVDLQGPTKIYLIEGPYAVIDANGTDGEAKFQLPNPDPDNDGTTDYSVFARALGKPNGEADMQTQAYEIDGEKWVESELILTLKRTHGKQKFENVSKYLLYIYYEGKRYPLFHKDFADWLWYYDNYGLRIAQLRFYEIPTTVPAP